MGWLSHAFAVEPPGPVRPTPDQAAVIDRICRELARRRLSTPALALLETLRPLNYLGAQALHVLAPLVGALTNERGCARFAAFLEQRGSVDYLCRRIEELEARSASGSPEEPAASPRVQPAK